MNLTPRVFQIIDNEQIDRRFPFALADDTGTIVEIGHDREALADIGFEALGADVVKHDGEVLRTDSRFLEREE